MKFIPFRRQPGCTVYKLIRVFIDTIKIIYQLKLWPFFQAVEREKSRYNFAPTVTGNLPGSRAFQYCREIARSRPTSRLSNRAILACTQIEENHIISQWSVNYLSHYKGTKHPHFVISKNVFDSTWQPKTKAPLISQGITCHDLPPYTALFLFFEYECLEMNSKWYLTKGLPWMRLFHAKIIWL